jgi:hypothetical protein
LARFAFRGQSVAQSSLDVGWDRDNEPSRNEGRVKTCLFFEQMSAGCTRGEVRGHLGGFRRRQHAIDMRSHKILIIVTGHSFVPAFRDGTSYRDVTEL